MASRMACNIDIYSTYVSPWAFVFVFVLEKGLVREAEGLAWGIVRYSFITVSTML
jgi:predicted DsbA family dithiol-disulfide isomerase